MRPHQTRREFLGKVASTSLGLGIGGLVPRPHGSVVLSQDVQDVRLNQLNRDLERVTRQVVQRGLDDESYQQIADYMRQYAEDARENQRDARLLDGIRTVLEHPEGGQAVLVDQMLGSHEEINATAREMGIQQAIADPVTEPDVKLTQFLDTDSPYTTAYDDVADTLARERPSVVSEAFCTELDAARDNVQTLTAVVCGFAGGVSALSLGALLPFAAGMCFGAAVGVGALWGIDRQRC